MTCCRRHRCAPSRMIDGLIDFAFASNMRATSHGVSYSFKIGFNGVLRAQMAVPARIAMTAIVKKKLGLLMMLQKLPNQPPRTPPAKLVPSHRPIVIDWMRCGATLETNDS